jgi:hypothetical protein
MAALAVGDRVLVSAEAFLSVAKDSPAVRAWYGEEYTRDELVGEIRFVTRYSVVVRFDCDEETTYSVLKELVQLDA